MQEILKASKAILNERWSPLSEWITVLPSVQWALNTAARRLFGTSSFHVMLGGEPRISFAILMEEKGELELTKLDETKLRAHVKGIVEAREQSQKEVVEPRNLSRDGERRIWRRDNCLTFKVEGPIPVARTRKAGTNVNLASQWTVPWRVVSYDRDPIYTVDHIVYGETHDGHRAYALLR